MACSTDDLTVNRSHLSGHWSVSGHSTQGAVGQPDGPFRSTRRGDRTGRER